MAEEEKDDWLDDFDDDSEESSDELDQSDIDALLSGDDQPAAEEESGELDQSDIDSLLSGDDSPAAAAPSGDPGGLDEGELDQSDIDALLGPADGQSADTAEAIGADPDQEEIDKLFSDMDDDQEEADPFQAEEVDFKDVIDDEEEDESFSLESSINEFADEDFGLDDDIPDIPEEVIDDTTLFEDNAGEETLVEQLSVPENSANADAPDKKNKKIVMPTIPVPAALKNKKNVSIIAGSLIVLIVAALFLFRDKDKSTDSEMVAQQKNVETTAQTAGEQRPVQAANIAPVVSNTEYRLNPADKYINLILNAHDPEGDPLSYEILSQPAHGQLTGTPPNLTYLPANNFRGEDVLVYRVSDGKDFSDPVTVKMFRAKVQDSTKVAGKPKRIKSKKLLITAKDLSYALTSTDDYYIDWEEVWNKANNLPFTDKVRVEILSDGLRGRLKKVSENMYQYQPDRYYGGKEVILYRFKLDRLRSKVKKLSMNVSLGSPAPKIVLQPTAQTTKPGEMAVLDAGATKDEHRDSLLFSWQQISGVPVQLEVLNQEGSRVAFIVPSSFSSIASPGPVLQLTVIDQTGKKDVKDIKVATTSRYQTAVWRGLADGTIAEEPYCPSGDCTSSAVP